MSINSSNDLGDTTGGEDEGPPQSNAGPNRVLQLLEKHKRDVQERMANREKAFRDILVRELAQRLERSPVTVNNTEQGEPTGAFNNDGGVPNFTESTFRRAFDQAFDTSAEIVLSSRESSTTHIPTTESTKGKVRRKKAKVENTGGTTTSQSTTSGQAVRATTDTSWSIRNESRRLENMQELLGVGLILFLTIVVLLIAFYTKPSGQPSKVKVAGKGKGQYFNPAL